MHTDLDDKNIARRLHMAVYESGEAPYDWAEFLRRRHRSVLTRAIERNRRPAAIAASVLAAVLVTALPFLRSTRGHAPPIAPLHAVARTDASDLQEQARTRAIESWLAGLPHNRVIVRVGHTRP